MCSSIPGFISHCSFHKELQLRVREKYAFKLQIRTDEEGKRNIVQRVGLSRLRLNPGWY